MYLNYAEDLKPSKDDLVALWNYYHAYRHASDNVADYRNRLESAKFDKRLAERLLDKLTNPKIGEPEESQNPEA